MIKKKNIGGKQNSLWCQGDSDTSSLQTFTALVCPMMMTPGIVICHQLKHNHVLIDVLSTKCGIYLARACWPPAVQRCTYSTPLHAVVDVIYWYLSCLAVTLNSGLTSTAQALCHSRTPTSNPTEGTRASWPVATTSNIKPPINDVSWARRINKDINK